MKFYLFLLFGICSNFIFSQSRNTSAKEIADLKGRIMIVSSQISNQEIYDNILYAFKQEWTYSDSVIQMQTGLATRLLFSTEKKYVRVQLKTYSLGSGGATIDYEGDDKRVTSGVGRISKLLISTEKGETYFIALPTDPDFTKEMFVEAVRRGIFIMKEIEEVGSWNKAYIGLEKKYASEINNKTLLICDTDIEDTIQKNKIQSIIPFESKFVPIETIDSLIQNKVEGFAYIVVTGENISANTKYVCSTKDGKVITRDHSASVTSIYSFQSDSKAKYYLRPQDIKSIIKNLQ